MCKRFRRTVLHSFLQIFTLFSSSGHDRKLTKPAEFERFTGRLARISTIEPVENQDFSRC
jgi:ribosome maturation factor RimP